MFLFFPPRYRCADKKDHLQHAVQFAVGQFPALCVPERGQILQWASFPDPIYRTIITMCSVTQDDIHADANTTVNGLDAWAEKGIAGRGVFIDYFDWAQERDIQYNTLTNHPIPIEHVHQIIAEKGITIRQGDILFMRTGTANNSDDKGQY